MFFRRQVQRFEKILSEFMTDGRLQFQTKDASFGHPVLARFASNGTLGMVACLVLPDGCWPRAPINAHRLVQDRGQTPGVGGVRGRVLRGLVFGSRGLSESQDDAPVAQEAPRPR